jgi:hypothetical protein
VPTALEAAPPSILPSLQVRVTGPEGVGLTPADLRRLFRGRPLTSARRERLAASGRVVALSGARIVGLAAYDPLGHEVRVHEFGADCGCPVAVEQIAGVLLDALEVACLACGARRLVLLPRAVVLPALLRSRGFVPVAEGAAGSWFEKDFPS